MASAKPVSSAVLLLQEVAPRNARARGPHTTGPHMIRTKLSGETTSTPNRQFLCRQFGVSPVGTFRYGLRRGTINERNVVQLLLDNAHKHSCRGGVKGVSSTSEDLQKKNP